MAWGVASVMVTQMVIWFWSGRYRICTSRVV